MQRRRSRRRWYVLLGVFIAISLFTFLAQKFKNGEVADAASTAGFDPGYIISDSQMSHYNSMTEAEIQQFLTSKNSCPNTNYNYYVSLSANPNYTWHWANGHFVCLSEELFGDGEVIGSGQTAAHIIWKAAQDYKINPKVILVLLQKETSLITDPIPNNGDYRKATGYGCPDTAACSSKYYGFKNQVRNAAKLFMTVLDGGWTNYPLGDNYIQYNPNAACGGSVVNVRNLATSALYRYTPYQPNAGALAAGYGTASCGAYGNRNFYLYFEDWFGGIKGEPYPSLATVLKKNRVAKAESEEGLSYRTNVEYYGWLDFVNGGEMSGTAGYSFRIEGLQMKLAEGLSGNVEYKTHVQNIGWTNYVKNGATSGQPGSSLQVEAVRIKLSGEIANNYDIYYRALVQNSGWSKWVKNGTTAGTEGKALKIEALQVKLVKKEVVEPAVTTEPTSADIEYQGHVEDYGWMNWVKNGALAGTTGQAKRVEAIKIKLPKSLAGSVSYQAHVQDYGWMNWVKNGALAGTTGQAKRVEAIKIKLDDELAKTYDVKYRVHVENIGWMNWVKNGALAGTTGQALRVEGIEIKITKK